MVVLPTVLSVTTPVVAFTLPTAALLLAYVIAPEPWPPEAAFVTVVPTAPDTGPAVVNAIVWD
jgi:hypothetical protein